MTTVGAVVRCGGRHQHYLGHRIVTIDGSYLWTNGVERRKQKARVIMYQLARPKRGSLSGEADGSGASILDVVAATLPDLASRPLESGVLRLPAHAQCWDCGWAGQIG